MKGNARIRMKPRLWRCNKLNFLALGWLCITTSQVTHVSAYAATATWPGDRLRLPLEPQPERQLRGCRA